jgi:hypothetical protein
MPLLSLANISNFFLPAGTVLYEKAGEMVVPSTRTITQSRPVVFESHHIEILHLDGKAIVAYVYPIDGTKFYVLLRDLRKE